jgi:hypothetical protein
LDRTLQELRLGSSGLVDAATAGKVGALVGARYFVSGRLMKTGAEWTCTVKLIDTETSELAGLRVAGTPEEGVVALADKTAAAIAQRLASLQRAPVPRPNDSAVALAQLKDSFAGRELPTVAVAVPESHIGTWVPDPAGENAIIAALTQAGYRVVDVKTFMKHEQPSWWASLFVGRAEGAEAARAQLEGGVRNAASIFKDKEMAKIQSAADVFVVGEAFSESAGEQSGFESCSARIELKVLDTKSEQVLWASSQHAVAADVSEHIAGKKALREGGDTIGLELAKTLATVWTKPAAGAGQQQ